MIDDILVTAVSSLGQNEILYTNRLKIYPSPNNGTFTLSSTELMDKISILDLNGKTIFRMANPSQKQGVILSGTKAGLYLLKVKFNGSDEELTTRFVVE
jgi:hypothetical protein